MTNHLNETAARTLVVTVYNSYLEDGTQAMPVLESIPFDTEEQAVEHLTTIISVEVEQMRRYRISNQSRYKILLNGMHYDEEGYRTNLVAEVIKVPQYDHEVSFDSDYTIMPDEDNMIPSFNPGSKEVGFFSVESYSPDQAVNAAWEHIKQLPYERSIIQPYTYMVRKEYIKENPLFNERPDEVDAYLYTTSNDPRAIAVWEVPFVLEQDN